MHGILDEKIKKLSLVKSFAVSGTNRYSPFKIVFNDRDDEKPFSI